MFHYPEKFFTKYRNVPVLDCPENHNLNKLCFLNVGLYSITTMFVAERYNLKKKMFQIKLHPIISNSIQSWHLKLISSNWQIINLAHVGCVA